LQHGELKAQRRVALRQAYAGAAMRIKDAAVWQGYNKA
jgi:hypothetical protein